MPPSTKNGGIATKADEKHIVVPQSPDAEGSEFEKPAVKLREALARSVDAFRPRTLIRSHAPLRARAIIGFS